MQLFKKETNFDFMGKRKLAMVFSLILVVVSLFSIASRGLNFGIDFTGGTLVEIGYQETVNLDDVRSVIEQAGFEDAVIQYFGTSRDVLVRIAPREGISGTEISTRVLDAIRVAQSGQAEMRRVEFVGPQVGSELTEDGGLAMIYALFGILVYVTLRFEKRFALGSVIALVHDVIITIGLFALFQIEFDLSVLAAVLAVIGYSLNDTIVVFDRIRENFRKIRKAETVEVLNVSINQTISRTLITSLTTLLVLISLFLFGGEIIHSFAIALIAGIVVGTYSSIYVASAATLALGVNKEDLMPVEKEGKELDSRP